MVLIYIQVKAHVRISKTYFFAFYTSNVPGFSLNFCFRKPVPKFAFNHNTSFYWLILCQNNKERIYLRKQLTFLLYIHGKCLQTSKYLANPYFLLLMYARVKIFTISLHTFEIPDFVRFQSPGDRFLFSEPVRPLQTGLAETTA